MLQRANVAWELTARNLNVNKHKTALNRDGD